MTNQEKLTVFNTLFRGRTDVYSRRWEKGDKSGWMPAYSFDWNEFNAHRARGGTIRDFENKKLLPLTDEILLNHLLGKETIGVYPIQVIGLLFVLRMGYLTMLNKFLPWNQRKMYFYEPVEAPNSFY